MFAFQFSAEASHAHVYDSICLPSYKLKQRGIPLMWVQSWASSVLAAWWPGLDSVLIFSKHMKYI